MHKPFFLVGEAWGEREEEESLKTGRPSPFVGPSGRLLDVLLRSSGIGVGETREDLRKSCFITNAFNLRPNNNKVENILVEKKFGYPGIPAFKPGKYLPEALLPEWLRLYSELNSVNPEVIITFGNSALWSLTGQSAIRTRHGYTHFVKKCVSCEKFIPFWLVSTHAGCLATSMGGKRGDEPNNPDAKRPVWGEKGDQKFREIPLIPTYHPAFLLRTYKWLPSSISDMTKGRKIREGRAPLDPLRLNPEPTLAEIREFREYLRNSPKAPMAVDIETSPEYRAITCIGVGTSEKALCIPFADPNKPEYNYWGTVAEEVEALTLLREILNLPNPKVLHNSPYDLIWLRAIFGLEIKGPLIDTMVAHASTYQELPHSLADVASVFLYFPPWKSFWKSRKLSEEGDKEEDK